MRGATLAAISVALAAASISAASPAGPTLQVTGTKPLAVVGTHFKARERITVTALSNGRDVNRVRASLAGEFATKFSDVVLGRCAGASVRAIGALGSRAVARVQRPACMPERSP